MPHITTGATDGPPGPSVSAAWVTLTVSEAHHLLESLEFWAEETAQGFPNPGWHMHIKDDDGNELTVEISIGSDEV
jgi:penicillin V acylase-like amidase (Ntn superfamily)